MQQYSATCIVVGSLILSYVQKTHKREGKDYDMNFDHKKSKRQIIVTQKNNKQLNIASTMGTHKHIYSNVHNWIHVKRLAPDYEIKNPA